MIDPQKYELIRALKFIRGKFKKDKKNFDGVVIVNADGKELRDWIDDVDSILGGCLLTESIKKSE